MRSLRLGGFRSYAAALVETGGVSVALSGPNGAGKTNLLEAVSLLVPGRGLRRAAPEALGRAGGPGWRLRAEVEGPGGLAEIVTGAEGGETGRSVEIDGKAAPQTRLGSLVRQVWLTPAMDRLWTEGAGERRRFLDRLTMGFEPGHAQVSIDYEKAMRNRNRLLRDGVEDAAWLAALETQMGRLGAAIARARAQALDRLARAQDAAGEVFPAAALAIEGPMEARFAALVAAGGDPAEAEAEEAAALARTLGRERGRDAQAGRTLSGPHRSDLLARYAAKDMPAAACSTGEQKALLVSLALANARALAAATGALPVLLMDEVAAHLDAGRRAALYAELGRLGAQVWATATGPELFEGMPADTLHLAVREAAGGSRLDPEPLRFAP